MATATEPITVLTTVREKSQIVAKAKNAGISMGELLQRAASSYCTLDDERVLEGMADQISKSTLRACSAIEKTIKFVAISSSRMTEMERKAAGRRN